MTFSRFFRTLTRPILTGVGCIALVACGDDGVQRYTVPKGSETIAPAPSESQTPEDRGAVAASGTQRASSASATSPGWVVPEGWRESPDNPPMRLATFLAAGQGQDVTIAVTRFAGDVGGKLANVNRWRGQLPPVSEADLASLLVTFSQPGFEGYFVHIESESSHLLVAGIHELAADRTWFVRATTSEADAERIERDILAFAKSFGTTPPHEHDSIDEGAR